MSKDANQSSHEEMEQLEELLSLQSMFELEDYDAARLWRLRRSLGDSVVSEHENSYERLSAEIDGGFALSNTEEMPADFKASLFQTVPDQNIAPKEDYRQCLGFDAVSDSGLDRSIALSISGPGGESQSDSVTKIEVEDPFVRKGPVSSASSAQVYRKPWLGWVAAAACLIFAVNVSLRQPTFPTDGVSGASEKLAAITDPEGDVAQQYAKRLYYELEKVAGSSNVVRVGWKGKDGKELPGDVIWDKEKQVGVMRLAVLPGDIKPDEDYQLWIFDPGRKERGDAYDRVSGPVFRLDRKESFILVQSPLHLLDVSNFAITIEDEGGVMVSELGKGESKRGKIAALSGSTK